MLIAYSFGIVALLMLVIKLSANIRTGRRVFIRSLVSYNRTIFAGHQANINLHRGL
jgi:hypothetical protein